MFERLIDMFNISSHQARSLGFLELNPKNFSIEDLTELYRLTKESTWPSILDDAMLADALGITKRTLYFVSSPWLQAGLDKKTKLKRNAPLYKVFRLKKGINRKTGKEKYRYIQSPEPRLKYVQTQVAGKILDKADLPEYITGFRKGIGARVTAEKHAGKNIVVSLDINNYFNSIKQTHLLELFTDFFHYPERVAKILSEICTYKYFVPQGAPSSPSLSNLVGYYFFDEKVKSIAENYGFTMTRYADDITLSTDLDFPKKETTNSEGKLVITSEIDKMVKEISSTLKRAGFSLNQGKTKVMRSPARKWVLGQVVNCEPNILRRDYNALRCIVHNISVSSVEEQAERKGMTEYQFLAWLKGKLTHLKQVNPRKGEKLLDKLELSLKAAGYQEDIKEIKINK
jgi:hypothetical protein